MKKILLLLFVTSLSYSQDNAKVTAYRLVNENDDGPCSVSSYVKWIEPGLINYVTAESYDVAFAQNLLKLKKLSKRWQQQNHFCRPGSLGGDMTHNMFVIEYNGRNDTILATYDNSKIIFPGKSKSYTDGKGVLKSMFPENIKKFFNYDFNKQINSWFMEKRDSIPADRVYFRNENAYGLTEQKFKQQHEYRLIVADTSFQTPEEYTIRKTYLSNRDTLTFDNSERLDEIIIDDIGSEYTVDSLRVGDNENALILKYPSSVKAKIFYNVRFEDLQRTYYYIIDLKDNKGMISFYIKDKIINKITIRF
jgi:hypothetical protein